MLEGVIRSVRILRKAVISWSGVYSKMILSDGIKILQMMAKNDEGNDKIMT
jgi:hypothetical protein